MNFLLKFTVFVLCLFILNPASILIADSLVEPIYFYASQPGEQTLDQGEGGGNPFASAFVELLTYETLTFDNFLSMLIDQTLQTSRGLQQPEILSRADMVSWQFLPISSNERRIALILVFSDYTNAGASSLPGARYDLYRISRALTKTGFEVHTAVDPDQSELNNILEDFSERSMASDIALLYTTGHGVEVDGTIYLLPGDYPIIYGKAKLNERAISLTRMGGAVRANKANLVFYGGCRNNPFDDQ